MIDARTLQQRAKKRWRQIERQRRDPRFRRVLGRLVRDGYLLTNEQVESDDGKLKVEDVLWAGQAEPRFLELLPALLVKQPALFEEPKHLPDDLAAVVRRLRRNLQPEAFRGVPGEALLRWLPEVGRRNKVPARLKSFRFREDDLRLLELLAAQLGVNETEVVRRGLRALAAALPPHDSSHD